uniref:Uncharacterized protein n=2 Tax=viral metagenome TaxID=1070528 RepID=A0A6M3KGX8_9ZZZZ
MAQGMAIRLGSIDRGTSTVREFGRAWDVRNVDIKKTNEISRRPGYQRRIEQQQTGPVRLLFPCQGLCGRYPKLVDGGGLVTITSKIEAADLYSITCEVATHDSGLDTIKLSWLYSNQTTTPPEGCDGVLILGKASGYPTDHADADATTIYYGSEFSTWDFASETDEEMYYTAWELYEDTWLAGVQVKFTPGVGGEDPPVVVAYGDPYTAATPSVEETSADTGVTVFATQPEVETNAAQVEDDGEALHFTFTAERSGFDSVTLVWSYSGLIDAGDLFVAVYHSTSGYPRLRGTPVLGTTERMGTTTHSTPTDVVNYYSAYFYVNGIGLYGPYNRATTAHMEDDMENNDSEWTPDEPSGGDITVNGQTYAAGIDGTMGDGFALYADLSSLSGGAVSQTMYIEVRVCKTGETTTWLSGGIYYKGSTQKWQRFIYCGANATFITVGGWEAATSGLPPAGTLHLSYDGDSAITFTYAGVTKTASYAYPDADTVHPQLAVTSDGVSAGAWSGVFDNVVFG